MSKRSVYLREQATKCRFHAAALTDPQTQEELRKLAAEYTEKAARLESEEAA